MKLGLLTAPFADLPLEDIADWASGSRFQALEVACWPRTSGETRRYAGTSHIDVAGMTTARADEITGQMLARSIEISGLGYYPNPLHADADHRAAVIGHLKQVIAAAALMRVPVVNTFVGGDRLLSVDENWDRAMAVWPDVVSYARDKGVMLAFENCPMIFSRDEWPGGHNIAYSPKIWRRIFDQWGDGVGMNFDPSHLVWQMIDQARFIREFGGRMVHVHAKDVMIDHDGLYENGVMSVGMGWQVPRMPGLGDIDWSVIFAGLYREGYDGAIIIEHEDRTFEGSDDNIKRGFLLARDMLRPYVR